jgi:hypothetical protein
MSLVDTAIQLAAWAPVFPCRPDKRPACPLGFKAATSDPVEIRRLFNGSSSLIGVPTGEASGFDVLDVDPRHGGDEWEEQNRHRLPETRIHQTMNGGRHWLFRHVEGVHNSASAIAPGIDVRGSGGYVVVPPSPSYSVVSDAEIAHWPDWLLAKILPKTRDPAPKSPPGRYEPIPSARLEGFVRAVLDRVSAAPEGQKHFILRNQAMVLGGIAHLGPLSHADLLRRLMDALPATTLDRKNAETTAKWGLEMGAQNPLELADRPKPNGSAREEPPPPTSEFEGGQCREHGSAVTPILVPSEEPDFPPDYSEDEAHEKLNGERVEILTRPTIQTKAGRPDLLATEAEDAIITSGLPVFQRGRELVRPAQFEVPASKGRMTISAGMRPLGMAGMLEIMAESAAWQKWVVSRKAFVVVDPPPLPASILLSRAGRWRFPLISGVITAPTIRPDGTMLSKPGYDAATRLYHVPDPTLTPEYVPPKPTKEQAVKALTTLDALLDEFPFTNEVSHSVALSCLMTPVLRGAIPVAPLHAIKASTAGTGKTYLADLASAIEAGRPCPVISLSVDAKETESRINGLLLGGFPLACLDNVNGELGNDILAQAITQPTIQVRRLGGSDIFEVESRATWFATGNGIRVRGDMTRRTIVCNLDAGIERPEMRQFTHRPLDDILNARARYIAAVLTIAIAYTDAGKPGRLPSPASFEEWSDLVRSPLVWLDRADCWDSVEVAREDDPELTALRDILTNWADAIGIGKLVTTRQVIETANSKGLAYEDEASTLKWPDFRDALTDTAGVKGNIDPNRLGKWLMGREGRIVDGRRLKRGKIDSHSKAVQWFLAEA